MVHGQVTKHTRLYLNLLAIDLPLNLISCLKLLAGEYIHVRENFDTLLRCICVNNLWSAGVTVKTTFLSLHLPRIAVAVTVKTDRLRVTYIALNDFKQSVFCRFALVYKIINRCLELCELGGHHGIESYYGTGVVSRRAHSTELKTVACECKRTGTVTVSIVN